MSKGNKENFSDEELMAFADGQCDAQLKSKIEAAASKDSSIQARIAMFRRSSELLQQSFAPVLDTQADDTLARMIRTSTAAPSTKADAVSNVVQFPAQKKPQPLNWQQAIAASVVLAIGVAGGYLWGSPDPRQPSTATTLAVAPAVQTLLNTIPSGQSRTVDTEQVTIIASFRDREGHFCREAESVQPTGGKSVMIACKKSEGWQLVLQAALPSTTGSYVPAGGEQALESFLQSAGLTEPLTADAEQTLLTQP